MQVERVQHRAAVILLADALDNQWRTGIQTCRRGVNSLMGFPLSVDTPGASAATCAQQLCAGAGQFTQQGIKNDRHHHHIGL